MNPIYLYHWPVENQKTGSVVSVPSFFAGAESGSRIAMSILFRDIVLLFGMGRILEREVALQLLRKFLDSGLHLS